MLCSSRASSATDVEVCEEGGAVTLVLGVFLGAEGIDFFGAVAFAHDFRGIMRRINGNLIEHSQGIVLSCSMWF